MEQLIHSAGELVKSFGPVSTLKDCHDKSVQFSFNAVLENDQLAKFAKYWCLLCLLWSNFRRFHRSPSM